MDYVELDNEQRRQLIDAQQTFATWWPASVALDDIGSMHWQSTKGTRYLIERHRAVRTSHGRESSATLKLKTQFDASKKALKARASASSRRLDRMAGVNRALRLGRLRKVVANILRELDRRQLLGTHVIVVGTNALHAFETAYGVLIGSEHVATTDADLLWDARKSLQLASTTIGPDGLMGILRQVDPSFTTNYGYNATNNDGYIVDLLSPELEPRVPLLESLEGDDLTATEMPGMIWLLEAPRFEQVVIADDGWPVRMVVPEPRTFAAHKLWVSRESSRKVISRRKDADHARLLASLITTHANERFTLGSMPWLSRELKPLVKELAKVRVASSRF